MTLTALEHFIADRTFVAGVLTAIGLAIAVGPEIRLVVGRIRREARANRDDDLGTVQVPAN